VHLSVLWPPNGILASKELIASTKSRQIGLIVLAIHESSQRVEAGMSEGKSTPRESEWLSRLRSQLEAESRDSLELLADIVNNPICSVWLDSSLPCVRVVWKRYATSTQLRFIHEHILHILEQHRARKILADDTALPTIHAEDQAWIVQEWMPRAIAAGLKASAIKSSAAYFGKLSTDTIQSRAPRGLDMRFFDSLDSARLWLESV
jgi:hypothetical protein